MTHRAAWPTCHRANPESCLLWHAGVASVEGHGRSRWLDSIVIDDDPYIKRLRHEVRMGHRAQEVVGFKPGQGQVIGDSSSIGQLDDDPYMKRLRRMPSSVRSSGLSPLLSSPGYAAAGGACDAAQRGVVRAEREGGHGEEEGRAAGKPRACTCMAYIGYTYIVQAMYRLQMREGGHGEEDGGAAGMPRACRYRYICLPMSLLGYESWRDVARGLSSRVHSRCGKPAVMPCFVKVTDVRA